MRNKTPVKTNRARRKGVRISLKMYRYRIGNLIPGIPILFLSLPAIEATLDA
jgi:hypothetical protein